MGTFERFTTKTHFNSLKRLVVLVGLAVLAVKLAVTAFWAASPRCRGCPPRASAPSAAASGRWPWSASA